MRKRGIHIQAWVNEDELKRINDKAKKCGLAREAYIRKASLECKIHEAPPTDFYTLNREMNRIGSNIEQILRVMNTKGFIDGPKLRTSLNELIALEEEMWRIFKPVNS